MTTAPFTIICVYWFTPIRFSPLSSNTDDQHADQGPVNATDPA